MNDSHTPTLFYLCMSPLRHVVFFAMQRKIQKEEKMRDSDDSEEGQPISFILFWLAVIFCFINASVKICKEYERAVIFRFGRLKRKPAGPGLFIVIPLIDKFDIIDLRLQVSRCFI